MAGARLGGGLIVGALCFGTGIAVALLYPVLLALLFSRERLGRSAWIALAVPVVVIALYRGVSTGEAATGDRLIELTGQLGRVGVFFAHLLASGASSLIFGPAWSRDAYPNAPTIAAAVIVGAVLLAGFVGGTWRTRRALAAMLLVTAGTYGAIAAARAGFYHFFAARQPNPLAFGATMARYHYEAQLALAAALGIALGPLLGRARLPSWMSTAVGALLLAGIVGASVLHPPSILGYASTRKAATLFVRGIRTRAERASEAVVTIPNRPWHGAGPFIDVRPDCFPGLAGAFVVFFPTDVVAGREVRFVTDDQRTLAARNAGGRISRLLVEPDADDGSLRP